MSDIAPFRDRSLEALRERLAALEPRTRAVVAGLSPERLMTPPPSGGWSVAECLEHLCRTNTLYVDRTLPPVVDRARTRPLPAKPFAPSLVGRFMLATLREGGRTRLPAPRNLNVRGKVREHVAEAFLAGVRKLESQMRESDGHDLRAGFRSPAMPIISLQLGDAFMILVEHAHRHLAQAERARASIGG